MFGVTGRAKSDNGPPFNSHEFANFTKHLGFKHWENELTEFRRNYRATPHSTTKVPPKDLLLKSSTCTSSVRNMKFKNSEKDVLNERAELNDKHNKHKMATQANKNLKTKTIQLKVNDWVLLRNLNPRKTQPIYDPRPFRVVEVKDSQCKVKRNDTI